MQSIPAKIPRTTNPATIPELDLSIVTSKNNKAYKTYHFLDPKSLASMKVVNIHFRNMLGADINYYKNLLSGINEANITRAYLKKLNKTSISLSLTAHTKNLFL